MTETAPADGTDLEAPPDTRPRTEGGVTGALGLAARDVLEKESHLGEKQVNVTAPKDLGHKRASRAQDVAGDVEGRQQQLRLHILVNVVHARDVGGTIAHHQIRRLASEKRNDFMSRAGAGDVALQLVHAGNRRHFLQVDGHNAGVGQRRGIGREGGCDTRRVGGHCARGVSRAGRKGRDVQDAGQDLRPRARGGAQVHRPAHAAKDVAFLVDLQELEGRPRPKPQLLGLAVKNVALVFAEATHGWPHLQ